MDAAEQDRLMQKGQRLYGRCLAKADTLCVTGFIAHQAAQADDRRPFIRAYLGWLQAQADELRHSAAAAPDALPLTETLITEVRAQLNS